MPIPTRWQVPVSANESTTDEDDMTIDDYVLNSNLEEKKPYYPNQKDLHDLIRNLGLTKSNAELLTSRLKQLNCLMTLFKLLSNVNGTKAFLVYSQCKMQFGFARMLVGFFTQLELP